MTIEFYSTKDRYGEFSNFAAYPITLDGARWPTSEHYFQAQKFEDGDYRETIRRTENPMTAAKLGRNRDVKIRSDWESVKIDVMRTAVREKFTSHAALHELLVSTGDEAIVEKTTSDEFWGCGTSGCGQNWLGRILVEIRSELREKRGQFAVNVENNQLGPNDKQLLFAGQHLSLVARGRWEYATRAVAKPAVGIVAITGDERVVLVEQFRVPVGERVIELPAGLSGDVAGEENESLLESAKRELMEETGYEAARWTELTRGYSSPGLTDEQIVLFLAEGLTKIGRGGGDQSEDITVHEVSLEGVMAWFAERGAKADLKLLAGLFAAQEARRRRSDSDE